MSRIQYYYEAVDACLLSFQVNTGCSQFGGNPDEVKNAAVAIRPVARLYLFTDGTTLRITTNERMPDNSPNPAETAMANW